MHHGVFFCIGLEGGLTESLGGRVSGVCPWTRQEVVVAHQMPWQQQQLSGLLQDVAS